MTYRGRWLVLFSYPADFTFVCPTELRAFAELAEDFAVAGAELLAVSTDGYYSHKAWFESDPALEQVEYAVAADTSHALSRHYGVLQTDGTAMRGTFVVDPQGVLRHVSVNDGSVGRAAGDPAHSPRAADGRAVPGRLAPRNADAGAGGLTRARGAAAERHLRTPGSRRDRGDAKRVVAQSQELG